MTDSSLEPVEKVFREFEMMRGVKLFELDMGSYAGKRFRAEFLVHLKERSGLRYCEIAEMELFSDIRINSLGVICHGPGKRGNPAIQCTVVSAVPLHYKARGGQAVSGSGPHAAICFTSEVLLELLPMRARSRYPRRRSS